MTKILIVVMEVLQDLEITHNFTVLLAATEFLLDLGITHNFTVLSGMLSSHCWIFSPATHSALCFPQEA